MSLINDALQRTRDANAASPQPPVATPVAPRPTLAQAPAQRQSSTGIVVTLIVLVVLAVIAIVAGTAWFMFQSRPTQIIAAPIPPPAPVAAVEPVPAPPPAPVVEVAAPAPTPVPAPVPVVVTPPPPPQPATPPRPRPELKLQGITIQGKYRDVMINGAIFKVGDSIAGVKILEIQPNWVRLEFDGAEFTIYQ